MIDESAEMQLKQLLTKALDESFAKGLEVGKRTGFEPGWHAAYLIGRRAGIEEAIVYLSARSKELFEVYDTTKIERRCDIYDIRHGEAEHCLGLVKTLLEAK